MTTVPATRGMAGDLAARQAALVAALVAGGEPPAGFDLTLVSAARRALLVKRSGEVARAWPLLAASLGADWPERFIEWAASRPPRGPQRDGRDFARERRSARCPLYIDPIGSR